MNIELPSNLAQRSERDFINIFGDLYEHSPWVAETALLQTKSKVEYNDLGLFHLLLSEILLNADNDLKQKLILAHPVLTGKRSAKKDMTEFSTGEQKSAGLDDCTDEEISMFEVLNQEYLMKFKFPFIMAIKEKNKEDIVNGFANRQNNSVEQEKQNAIAEINKIAWLRIKCIYGI
ncbi:MAG: 2-oxo-4-hydroxy-4-carboxy-5-ureidoimidazoline decarboxylase [PS1 clade bacterium]